jgi:dTDP-4-amino-4,6-dideoxygalactose transaminase
VKHIPFTRPALVGGEIENIQKAISSDKLSGDGYFTRLCHEWFAEYYQAKCLLTTSCTHALEMISLLIDLEPSDEIIMPSYTFVSTANPFVMRGARVKFVDIDPNTMNIDIDMIERHITKKTKAIVVVHYAGVSCDMDRLKSIAKNKNVILIEDAAQALGSHYKGKPLGSFGDLSAVSFHDTKNVNSGGEGGLLIINSKKYEVSSEIIREKGTNRSEFMRGEIGKYTWVGVGSSYLPSELQAAFLYAQVCNLDKITSARVNLWNRYYAGLKEVDYIELPSIPDQVVSNGHIFYIKLKDQQLRSDLIEYLAAKNIQSVFHYIPLHSSPFGIEHTEFLGLDEYTTSCSNRLLRLPLWYGLTVEEVDYICSEIKFFLSNKL